MKPFSRHNHLFGFLLLFLGSSYPFTAPAQLYQFQQAPAKEWISILWMTHYGYDSLQVAKQMDSIRGWALQHHDTRLWEYTFAREMLVALSRRRDTGATFREQEAVFLQEAPRFAAFSEELKAVYNLQLGRLYFYNNRFDKAFHYIVQAIDKFEQIGFGSLGLPADIPRDLFFFFYKFGDYYTAEKYCQLAVQYNDGHLFRKPFDMNNLGKTYLQLKDYPKAKQTFLETMQYCQARNDSVYFGLASGNYGQVLRLEGRYQEALPYLYTDVVYNSVKVPENAARNCMHVAYCLLHLDSITKAKQYLDLALRLQPDRVLLETWYETVALYLEKTGEYRQAALYKDTVLQVADSLKNHYNTRVLMAARLKDKEEKLLSERKRAAAEARNLAFVRNLIIAALSVVFILTVALLDQKRRKERKERLLQQEKQRRAEEMLQRANEKLEQYLQNLREKNSLIEKLETEISALPPANGAGQQLQQLRYTVILTDADWQTFKQLFEEVWPGFFDRVRHRYLGLTEGDERLLALYKLNLPPKEMAAMLGISPESLRKNRYRLRKKYPSLEEDEEFKGG